ncbi:patatin-like phospholipase family protein [Azospirillum sp. HJ39]|uniref:patatin-like phospholipase family protein n=1 Tax=Azospirillum sp. HJ39 TaxID=3159496 RepID=UPI003558B244
MDISHNGPIKIQLALQGGGAKLCDLLAAAEAVQTLINEEKITVTRVSGTSAGAIVACLLATGEPIGRIRERLLDTGQKHLAKIKPRRSKLKLFFRALTGNPLYEPEPLRQFLADIFKINGKRYEKFDDLKAIKEIIITASDLLNGSRVTYRRYDKDGGNDTNIVSALFDSCALPFVFKSAKFGGTIVDGGICENLPAKELLESKETYGEVFAFSFMRDPAPKHPTNFFSYGTAILNTAISNSVDRAVSEIGHGQVFKIDTDISTFDFEGALSRGLQEDHYGRVRMQSYEWLKDVTNLMRINPEPTAVDDPEDSASTHKLMESIHKIYLSHHHTAPVRYERSQIEVTAWPLLTDHRYNRTYHILHRVTFRPQFERVHCVRLGLFSDGVNMVKGLVTGNVKDAHGNKINTTIVPVNVPEELQKDPLQLRRYLLFFFDGPILPQDSDRFPYTLELHDYVEGCLDGIKRGENEWVSMISDRTCIEEVDIVVYLPESYKNVSTYSYMPQNEAEHCISGRRISEQEMVQSHYDPAPGFVALGWRGNNLQLGQTFGLMLVPGR